MSVVFELGSAPSTSAGIITAIATMVTAVGVLFGGLAVLLPAIRRLDHKVDVVHTIVNQQRTDAQRYNIALAELLRKNDIAVPIDQSLPVTGDAES